jgi:hypothetical protein
MAKSNPNLAALVLAGSVLGAGCGEQAAQQEEWVVTSDSQEATVFADQASLQVSSGGVIWFHEKMVLHKYQSDLAKADWLVTIDCRDQQVTQAGWTGWHRDGRVTKQDYFVVAGEWAESYLRRCRKLLPQKKGLLDF